MNLRVAAAAGSQEVECLCVTLIKCRKVVKPWEGIRDFHRKQIKIFLFHIWFGTSQASCPKNNIYVKHRTRWSIVGVTLTDSIKNDGTFYKIIGIRADHDRFAESISPTINYY